MKIYTHNFHFRHQKTYNRTWGQARCDFKGIMGSVLLITFEVSVLHIVLDSLCTSIGSIVFKCEGKDTNLFSNIQIFNAEK